MEPLAAVALVHDDIAMDAEKHCLGAKAHRLANVTIISSRFDLLGPVLHGGVIQMVEHRPVYEPAERIRGLVT